MGRAQLRPAVFQRGQLMKQRVKLVVRNFRRILRVVQIIVALQFVGQPAGAIALLAAWAASGASGKEAVLLRLPLREFCDMKKPF